MREGIASSENDGGIGVGPQRCGCSPRRFWVDSEPITFPELGVTLVLAGKYDANRRGRGGVSGLLV